MPIWNKNEDQRNEEHASSYINGPKSTGRPLFFHLDPRQLSGPDQQSGEVSPYADFPILPKSIIEFFPGRYVQPRAPPTPSNVHFRARG